MIKKIKFLYTEIILLIIAAIFISYINVSFLAKISKNFEVEYEVHIFKANSNREKDENDLSININFFFKDISSTSNINTAHWYDEFVNELKNSKELKKKFGENCSKFKNLPNIFVKRNYTSYTFEVLINNNNFKKCKIFLENNFYSMTFSNIKNELNFIQSLNIDRNTYKSIYLLNEISNKIRFAFIEKKRTDRVITKKLLIIITFFAVFGIYIIIKYLKTLKPNKFRKFNFSNFLK